VERPAGAIPDLRNTSEANCDARNRRCAGDAVKVRHSLGAKDDSVQLVPFHTSTREAPVVAVGSYAPTATQDEADVQEMLSSSLNEVAALGVGEIVQAVPFQVSARVSCTLELVVTKPTASHELTEVHDTASRWLPSTPVGFGVGSIVQAVPFQASASVTKGVVGLNACPTAVHAVGDMHDTEESPF
jgi:hypothetical protein